MFKKRFEVRPNTVGFLYKDNRLVSKLDPGRYEYYDFRNRYDLVTIPTVTRLHQVINQEVLTEDNIALRFSYVVEYRIADPEKFVERFNVLDPGFYAMAHADLVVHTYSQVHIRTAISGIRSELLNEYKDNLLDNIPATLNEELADYGIVVDREILRDVTFPKSIQQLFSRKLEAKIRAEADLENARSVVAAARTMKNAAQLMGENDNIRYLQFLETMNKIAAQGKHTFVIGEGAGARHSG